MKTFATVLAIPTLYLVSLSEAEKALILNLITTSGFFLMAFAGFYIATSINGWCRYGRETLGFLAGFVGTIGVIRLVSICGFLSQPDARLISGFVAIGFFFSIVSTIYTHIQIHRNREAVGLPPTGAKGIPDIPIMVAKPHDFVKGHKV